MMDCLKFRGAGNPLPSPNSSPKLPQLYTTSPGTEHLKLAAVPFPRLMLSHLDEVILSTLLDSNANVTMNSRMSPG